MFHGGMPAWTIVGLPDIGVKESKDRIKTAIKNCGVELLSRKYIINLSPADVRKEGTSLDLAIAVAVLQSIGEVRKFDIDKVLIVGELSLDGKINKINGVLPICLEALKYGISKIIVPFENIDEATTSLVAMSQAYNELEKGEIIDVLNNIGNNYSIATDQLATALQSSAATLKTQGNDLNEAVALITAGKIVLPENNSNIIFRIHLIALIT